MSGRIHIFLERIPPAPIIAEQGCDSQPLDTAEIAPHSTSATASVASEAGSGWIEALVLPQTLIWSLREQGLDQVAWFRWLGAAITGAEDARVYRNPACRDEDLLPPETAIPHSFLPMPPTHYYVRMVHRERQVVCVPLHPKDAASKPLTSRPPGDPTPWRGLEKSETLRFSLRDLNRCQLSGVRKHVVATHASHVIPRRRGNQIFDIIAEARHPQGTEDSVPTLDSLGNIVTLEVLLHKLWDANTFCLLPFPNRASDSQGRPLPYTRANTVETGEAKSFISTEFLLAEHVVASASQQRPVVRFLMLQPQCDFPALEPFRMGQHRLRGPFGSVEESPWPAEWIWAYRCASQIVTLYGTRDLRQELQRFWDGFYVDPRGSSETGSSATVTSGTDGEDRQNHRIDVFDAFSNRTPGRSSHHRSIGDADRTPARLRQPRRGGPQDVVSHTDEECADEMKHIVVFGRPTPNFLAEAKCQAWRCDVAAALALSEEGTPDGEAAIRTQSDPWQMDGSGNMPRSDAPEL